MTDAEAELARAGIITRNDRWTPVRKGVLLDVLRRWPEETEALVERFGLTTEELGQWMRDHRAGGIGHLKVSGRRLANRPRLAGKR